jgi:hypothetical protein
MCMRICLGQVFTFPHVNISPASRRSKFPATRPRSTVSHRLHASPEAFDLRPPRLLSSQAVRPFPLPNSLDCVDSAYYRCVSRLGAGRFQSFRNTSHHSLSAVYTQTPHGARWFHASIRSAVLSQNFERRLVGAMLLNYLINHLCPSHDTE